MFRKRIKIILFNNHHLFPSGDSLNSLNSLIEFRNSETIENTGLQGAIRNILGVNNNILGAIRNISGINDNILGVNRNILGVDMSD